MELDIKRLRRSTMTKKKTETEKDKPMYMVTYIASQSGECSKGPFTLEEALTKGREYAEDGCYKVRVCRIECDTQLRPVE